MIKSRRIIFFLIFCASCVSCKSSAQKLTVKEFETKCDQNLDPYRIATRIIDQKIENGILSIELSAIDTCCFVFEPTVIQKNNSLYLDYMRKGDPCECICAYRFTYKIDNVESIHAKLKMYFMNKPIELSNERYKVYPVKYDLVQNDTINRIDRYGLKQGKWNAKDDILMSKFYIEYKDDTLVRRVSLYPNGQIKSELIKEKATIEADGRKYSTYWNFNKYFEYFESGQKKVECSCDDWRKTYEEGLCKKWNEKGELIYQGSYR
jgi:hypothetical protein